MIVFFFRFDRFFFSFFFATQFVVSCVVTNPFQVFVHGPTTGVPRHTIPIRRIALTDFVVKVSRGARTKALTKAWRDSGVDAKWEKTAWAKKIALKKKRANTTDFERFKITAAKRTVHAHSLTLSFLVRFLS